MRGPARSALFHQKTDMAKRPAPKLLRLTRCEREALKVARQALYQKGGCITGGGWDRHCDRIDALLKRA